jgi:hypothetical protein
MPTLLELIERWDGKHVRTERPLTKVEYDRWCGPDPLGLYWHEGYLFGGECWVVGFIERDGRVWIQADYDMEWPIDDQTTITEVMPSEYSGPDPGVGDREGDWEWGS